MKVFEIAEVAKYNPTERKQYEESVKYYRDWKNALDTAAYDKAIEIAKKMKEENTAIDFIAKVTGLNREEIEKL